MFLISSALLLYSLVIYMLTKLMYMLLSFVFLIEISIFFACTPSETRSSSVTFTRLSAVFFSTILLKSFSSGVLIMPLCSFIIRSVDKLLNNEIIGITRLTIKNNPNTRLIVFFMRPAGAMTDRIEHTTQHTQTTTDVFFRVSITNHPPK